MTAPGGTDRAAAGAGAGRRRARIGVLLGLVGVLALAAGSYALMNARSVQLFGEIVHRVETEERVVALTFDDGPTDRVPEIASILAERDVRATFFLTGHELAQRPEAGRQLVAAGHELGNHSWSHERMLLMPRRRIAEELERTDAQIRAAGHAGPIHFRPPYGKKLVGLPRHLAAEDRLSVMADVEPERDPAIAADPEAIVEHVAGAVRPGSIILLHLMYEANAPSRRALPEVIDRLRADGYRFVTLDELLERRRPAAP